MQSAKFRKRRLLSRVRVIALGFLAIIAVGTLLLMLPISTRSGECAPFLDAAFTATSASCVTGLVVHDTGLYWSVFGQCVILLLIQLGGLGFMTFATLFFMLLRQKIGLRQREMLNESINNIQTGGVSRLVSRIVKLTLTLEGAGAALLAIRFVPQYGWARGIFMAVFHAVSALCNAGFDLMGPATGAYSSFTAYASDWLVSGTLMALILLGGLGFVVWDDLLTHRCHVKRYRFHTKLVLTATAVLVVVPTVLFFLLERNATGADMGISTRILTSLFGSVTPRTAGFNSVDTAGLAPGSKLLTIMLMFVGGSPGSTAGGVKTTTILVILLSAVAYMKNRRTSGAFGRRFEEDSLRKAAAVCTINLTLVFGVIFALCLIEALPLTDLVFESFSAIGTVGMSTGVTRELSALSRVLIAFLMYCGRVGSLSFATALTDWSGAHPVTEPAEAITIG